LLQEAATIGADRQRRLDVPHEHRGLDVHVDHLGRRPEFGTEPKAVVE
jgi:hypothetical protein